MRETAYVALKALLRELVRHEGLKVHPLHAGLVSFRKMEQYSILDELDVTPVLLGHLALDGETEAFERSHTHLACDRNTCATLAVLRSLVCVLQQGFEGGVVRELLLVVLKDERVHIDQCHKMGVQHLNEAAGRVLTGFIPFNRVLELRTGQT